MADLDEQYRTDGFVVFDADPRVIRWANAAHSITCDVVSDGAMQEKWLRHGRTWFVGVDALPNDPDGSIAGVPLVGAWEQLVTPPRAWHAAQLSVVYDGYPKRDANESEAAHQFRVKRDAAHVDGLHLEDGKRIVREPHAFVLGLPLNESDASPLVVWRGSHEPMRATLQKAVGRGPVLGADVSAAYKAARANIFERFERIEVQMRPGQSVLLNRFLLHGVAPWSDATSIPPEGRMVGYFRPVLTYPEDWLRSDGPSGGRLLGQMKT